MLLELAFYQVASLLSKLRSANTAYVQQNSINVVRRLQDRGNTRVEGVHLCEAECYKQNICFQQFPYIRCDCFHAIQLRQVFMIRFINYTRKVVLAK